MGDLSGFVDRTHIMQVYRSASYVVATTSFFDYAYTDVLRDTGGWWNPSINKARIKKSGIYAISHAAACSSSNVTSCLNLNGDYLVGNDYPSAHTSLFRIMWLDEGDLIGAAGFKTASMTMTLDITRAFTIAGPLR